MKAILYKVSKVEVSAPYNGLFSPSRVLNQSGDVWGIRRVSLVSLLLDMSLAEASEMAKEFIQEIWS